MEIAYLINANLSLQNSFKRIPMQSTKCLTQLLCVLPRLQPEGDLEEMDPAFMSKNTLCTFPGARDSIGTDCASVYPKSCSRLRDESPFCPVAVTVL